uniref:Uncharacterized protein n=1 Tax=uncultured Desulfobacterium sp. TaxID=201089 RepID=E1YHZ4_9BACT|nr:unknown protein [uncultured Desulfobacterium sp.]
MTDIAIYGKNIDNISEYYKILTQHPILCHLLMIKTDK